jgi:large conductance mechanosensitive channel
MSMMDEFKEFAMKGNVVDLAVGVIIGGAFGKIISSLVENILMPLIGLFTGGADFTKMAVPLGTGPNAVQWKYGVFIQSIFDFLIIAFCLFAIIKAIKKPVAAAAPPPPPPSPSELYLKDIRDALAKR